MAVAEQPRANSETTKSPRAPVANAQNRQSDRMSNPRPDRIISTACPLVPTRWSREALRLYAILLVLVCGPGSAAQASAPTQAPESPAPKSPAPKSQPTDTPAAEAPATPELERIESLVDQLGASSFRARESAMAQLLQAGPVALPTLRRVNAAGDAEMRQRVAIVTERLDREDFENRVAQFQADPSSGSLPGWEYAAARIGDTEMSREMFVSISRRHRAFAAALAGDANERAQALAELALEVRAMKMDFMNQPKVPDVVAVLMVASDPDVPGNAAVDVLVVRLFQTRDINGTLNDPVLKDMMRHLVGTWIVRVEKEARLEALAMGVQLGIEPTRELARRTIADVEGPQGPSTVDVTTVEWALRAVAVFGSPSDAPAVAPLLDDERPAAESAYTPRDPAGRVMQVQVRDLAMATIAIIHDRDPRDIGFPIGQTHPTAGFDADSLGFPVGEAGEQARQRVRQEIDAMIEQSEAATPQR